MAAAGHAFGNQYKPVANKLGVECRDFFVTVAVFFLSRLLTRTRLVVTEIEADIIRNRKIVWSVNIGVPVDYLDSDLKDLFSTILKAAWDYSYDENAKLNVQELSKQVYNLSQSERSQNCHVVPELAACVTPFALASGTPDGLYSVFDIGSGSIDGATFELSRTSGSPRINFFTSKVDMLGVDWIVQEIIRKAEQELSAEELKKCLIRKDGFLDLPYTLLLPFAKDIYRHVSEVIINAKMRDQRDWLQFMPELPLFISGGGRYSDWHRHEMFKTYYNNNHRHAGIPKYAEWEIPVPDNIALNGLPRNEFYRFLVAYGLSIPLDEGPEIIGFPKQKPRAVRKKQNRKEKLDDIQWEKYGEKS